MLVTALALALIGTPEEAYALLEEVPGLVQSGDLDQALARAEAALRADAENFEAMSIAAALAERTGDPSRALVLQRAILAFDPNADEARLAIARLELALGNREAARAMNEALLERHPQSEEALKLRKAIRLGKVVAPPEPEKPGLAPLVRLDLVTGYDSNPTLRNEEATGGAIDGGEAVEDVSILTLDGSVGFYAKGKDRPLTVLARVRNTSSFEQSPTVNRALASTLGLSTIGRRRFSENALGVADLRYQALFVNSYSDFLQHFIAPSALFLYELGTHELRALAGIELRFFDGDVSDSVTPRIALRDTMRFGDAMLIMDLGGRLNLDITDDDGTGLDSDYVGFAEASALVFGQYELAEDFTGFVGTDLRWRLFDARVNGSGSEFDPTETVVQILAGLRYRLDIYELHVEYAYSRAEASIVRAFDRQQITGGVRVWYY